MLENTCDEVIRSSCTYNFPSKYKCLNLCSTVHRPGCMYSPDAERCVSHTAVFPLWFLYAAALLLVCMYVLPTVVNLFFDVLSQCVIPTLMYSLRWCISPLIVDYSGL
jgi:hypothetical protein